MRISFAEIAARMRLTPSEAVALALAAADELSFRAATGPIGVASIDDILLSSSGQISLRDSGDPPADESGHTRWLAELLQQLLTRQADAPGECRSPIPGGLLLLLARASGRIDLPQPSYSSFIDGLTRFSDDGARSLTAIYWLCARRDGGERKRRAAPAVLPWPNEARTPERTQSLHEERRRLGSEVSDRRRELREAERRLFEAMQRLPAAGPRRWFKPRIRVVAFALAALGFGLGLTSIVVLQRSDDVRPLGASIDERRPPQPQAGRAAVIAAHPQPVRRAAAGGAPLPGRADAFSPAFAASGSELLFHTGRERAVLMRASLDGQGKVIAVSPLLRDDAANYHVTPSPDGRWIAYDSDREGTRAVYVARPDATDARRVSGAGHAAVPTWSPDGRRLAFVKAEPRRSHVWNIWVTDVNAGTLSRITHHRVGQPWGASWFPDGTRIAYSLEDTLVIADLRNGSSHVVKSPRPGTLVRTPAVSPDGNRIIFQVYREGVWLLDVTTGALRRILDDRTAEEFAWSPDGRRVAYHARRNGGWSLWHASVDPEHGAASAAVAMLE